MTNMRLHPGFVQCSLLAATCIMLAGCTNTPEPAVGNRAATPNAALGQASFLTGMPANYPLHANDVVSITVFREPDLSVQNVLIDAEGFVAMPLIGKIKASGQTPEELQGTIKRALGNGMLRDPQVTVSVMDYASHLVAVEGAVSKAGLYRFTPGTRLSGAIALAGGGSRVAKKLIIVLRPDQDGMTVAKFDADAMLKGTMIDPLVLPGDRIIVGTSGPKQLWQDLIQALPAFALFTRL